MRALRIATLIAILTLGAAGCDKSPIGLRPDDLALERAGRQKPSGPNGAEGCGDLPTAPPDQRVDLYTPTFSDPTNVTNPLFPIGALDRVLLLGSSDGEPLRVETTLLRGTKTIRVNGRKVEALVSQYVAWLDRRIHEVALDWYVQDDQGAVWYLGEDVFNYEDGRIADTEGTWLAGREGPAAMIMPAHPEVGDVWRPKNACGVVFEEVTALATGVTVQGPRGPISGALIVRELHMEGTTEDKTFAPGYGEFSTGAPGGDLEAVALAVPTDALSGPTPAALTALSAGASTIFAAAKTANWSAASAALDAMNASWTAFRATGVPPLLEAEMDAALEALDDAVDAHQAATARQASIDVARASLDLQLRHRPRVEIDLAQIELWERQVAVDTEAGDRAAIRGDLASIKWIRDRLPRR